MPGCIVRPVNQHSSSGGTKVAVASWTRRIHWPTWTRVESAYTQAGQGSRSPIISPGRYVSIWRPCSSKPRGRGTPSTPASSRCRSRAWTVGVHGAACLWTTSPIRTAPSVLPPGRVSSLIAAAYQSSSHQRKRISWPRAAAGRPRRLALDAPYSRIHPRRPGVFRHHHAHEKPMTETERETLLSQGAVIQGMVMRNEPSAADPRISRVRVSVRFSGDQTAEFSEELPNLYQPASGSPEARRIAEVRQAQQLRHADRIPKIQLPLSDGERVPVRYDAADRSRLVLDVPALQKRAQASRDPGPLCQFCHQPVPVEPVHYREPSRRTGHTATGSCGVTARLPGTNCSVYQPPRPT